MNETGNEMKTFVENVYKTEYKRLSDVEFVLSLDSLQDIQKRLKKLMEAVDILLEEKNDDGFSTISQEKSSLIERSLNNISKNLSRTPLSENLLPTAQLVNIVDEKIVFNDYHVQITGSGWNASASKVEIARFELPLNLTNFSDNDMKTLLNAKNYFLDRANPEKNHKADYYMHNIQPVLDCIKKYETQVL